MTVVTILEGPDCCGKSMLAQKLAGPLRAEIIHTNGTKPLGYYADVLQAGRPRLILDRWLPSEYVHDPFRDPALNGVLERRLVERWTWTCRPVTVYVRPSRAVLEARWALDQGPFTIAQLGAILGAYDRYDWPHPGWVFDPTTEDLGKLVEGIKEVRPAPNSARVYGIEHADALRIVCHEPESCPEVTSALIQLFVPERELAFVAPYDVRSQTVCRATLAIGDDAIAACREVKADFLAVSSLEELDGALTELPAKHCEFEEPKKKVLRKPQRLKKLAAERAARARRVQGTA